MRPALCLLAIACATGLNLPGMPRSIETLIAAGRQVVAPAGAQLSWYRKEPPPLPAPNGPVVRVTTSRELAAAVASLRSGTTVVIAPGRYQLAATLAIANVQRVAIRGETGNPDDVVLEGPGLHALATPFKDAIWTANASDVLLAGFTLRDMPRHCVILNAGTERPRVHAVHFIDCGEQAMKANPDAAGRGIPGGIVEYSRFEYTTTSRGTYTNGISAIGATGWIVRHTLFRNIRAPRGQLAGPALLFRGGARGTVIDSNTFIDCQRGVSFGMRDDLTWDHAGGIIRNNFFVRAKDQPGDTAISLWNAPGAQVVHNTILVNGTYHAAIDYRWSDRPGTVIANNLLDAPIWRRESVEASTPGNVVFARPDWFRDAASGDLHLEAAGAGAFGQAAGLPGTGAEHDWDGDPRPASGADAGADQRTRRP
jgi:hypothetical protein